MHYFIGLTFFQHYLQFKKIDSLRRRFDAKYTRSNILQMTILPPFRLPQKDMTKLRGIFEHLEEELEGHLLGLQDVGQIEFKGIDFRDGRTGVLYLKPILPIDLFHCQESLREILDSYGAQFSKNKLSNLGSNLEVFLPIGRFNSSELLETAVETARNELNIPFTLQGKDLSLFEKTPGQWAQKKKLFSFTPDFSSLQHNEILLNGPSDSQLY